MIKRLILLLLAGMIYYATLAQVPAEEAALALRYSQATATDMYANSDSSAVWLFEIKHLRGRKFKFVATCVLTKGSYLVSNYQPSNPIGLIMSPGFKFRQYSDLYIKEGDIKERPRKSEWHKCGKYHKCETDNTLRIYKGVTYSKKLRIKRGADINKQYFDGDLVFRTYSAVSTSPPAKYYFLMRFGVPK